MLSIEEKTEENIKNTMDVNIATFFNLSTIDLKIKDILGSTVVNRGSSDTAFCPIYIYRANKITRKLTLTQIDEKNVRDKLTFTISSSRNTCGTYDILTMPYKTPDGHGIKVNAEYSDPDKTLRLFQAMTTTWSDNVVYDIQVLPYCPIPRINKKIIDLAGLDIGIDVTYVMDGATRYGYMFYAKSADCNYDITYDIPAITNKTDYLCKKYRLVAPNFGSSYDIPVALNWGVDSFNVSITALPYSPWVKITPVFKGFNGANYNDSRGLILNGSLQITQITDAFAQYQYSNANYQSIFDRQIENSQNLYEIQREQNIKSGIANVISAGISGASAGGMAGGVAGAAAGAVVGAAASAWGLSSDLKAAEKTQAENIDYTKDQFTLSMGNIKSQGSSISKVTAINEANKLIPFIEYYDATDSDREAVTNKLLYNGMSINRIGRIIDYVNTSDNLQYYQTKLILPDGVTDGEYNYDYLNALGLELSKGFFADYDTITLT